MLIAPCPLVFPMTACDAEGGSILPYSSSTPVASAAVSPATTIPAAVSAVASAAIAAVLASARPWWARDPAHRSPCPSPSYSPEISPPSSDGEAVPVSPSHSPCPSPSYSPWPSPPSSDGEGEAPPFLSGFRRGFLLPYPSATGPPPAEEPGDVLDVRLGQLQGQPSHPTPSASEPTPTITSLHPAIARPKPGRPIPPSRPEQRSPPAAIDLSPATALYPPPLPPPPPAPPPPHPRRPRRSRPKATRPRR